MARTFKPDWYCTGCLCKHGGRIKQHGIIAGELYCEQTYYKAAEKAGRSFDKQTLANNYAKREEK